MNFLDSFINLDITVITESRIEENVSWSTNIQLPKYFTEHTTSEASAGGALMYINNRLSYKRRADLKMYAPGKLESVFTELICINTENLVIGCKYKHPMLQIW